MSPPPPPPQNGAASPFPNTWQQEESTRTHNLTVLQRVDPFVEEILITAAHVTFYQFDLNLHQWSRKDVEGSLFVVKRNAQPRFQFIVMNRRSTDVGNGWSAKDDYFTLKGMTDDKSIDCHSPHPTPEGDQEQGGESAGSDTSSGRSTPKLTKVITTIDDQETSKPVTKSAPEAKEHNATPRSKPHQLGRTISGFLVRRTRRSKRFDRSRTDTNSKVAKDDAGSADEGSGSDQATSEDSMFTFDPSQLPPPTPRRNAPSINTVPLGKQRAAWSITEACMAQIRDHLNNDPIDQEAIQVLLTSIEISENDTGYTFANWRTSVAKFVAKAKRFERQNMVRQAEASVIKWEKAVAEAQLSLNEERKQLSEVERAVKYQFDAREAVFMEIQELETERESLEKQLDMKRRELECRKKDSLTNKKEHAYHRLSLEHTKQNIMKREEAVIKAEAATETAESDARAEQDRLSAILKQFITQLQGFEIRSDWDDSIEDFSIDKGECGGCCRWLWREAHSS